MASVDKYRGTIYLSKTGIEKLTDFVFFQVGQRMNQLPSFPEKKRKSVVVSQVKP